MRLGELEWFLLSDGEWRMDGGAIFGVVPKVLWERILPADELNRVPMALNSLLIVSRGKRILVETGFGRKLSPKQAGILAIRRDGGDLLDQLQCLGYEAGDIDVVINTHLHSDHCGGNTVLRDGEMAPAFPHAEYWIQESEWADARTPNERTRNSYLPENLASIAEAGQLRLVQGDAHVTDEVRCVATRGHTRGHQSVIIESNGQAGLFLGDLAGRAVHLERLSWTTAFDVEPLETIEAKRSIRDWALKRDALLFFGHDTRVPSGHLVREGDEFTVMGS